MIQKSTPLDLLNLPPFPGESEIHRRAGFRISSFGREASYPPLERLYRRSFQFYSLSHLIRGRGWFWTPRGGYEFFTAGQGVMVEPGAVHCYGGHKAEFVEDFLCFDGEMTRFLRQAGILRTGILRIGTVRRLLPLIDLASDPSVEGQLRANGEFFRFLTELYLENRQNPLRTGHEEALNRLIQEMRKDPGHWWSLEAMAASCRLSVNHFRTLFRRKTGHAPRDYQEELRISRSRELLLSPGRSIADIAQNLGYRDVYHFSKVFKKRTGLSPRAYRLEHSLAHIR